MESLILIRYLRQIYLALPTRRLKHPHRLLSVYVEQGDQALLSRYPWSARKMFFTQKMPPTPVEVSFGNTFFIWLRGIPAARSPRQLFSRPTLFGRGIHKCTIPVLRMTSPFSHNLVNKTYPRPNPQIIRLLVLIMFPGRIVSAVFEGPMNAGGGHGAEGKRERERVKRDEAKQPGDRQPWWNSQGRDASPLPLSRRPFPRNIASFDRFGCFRRANPKIASSAKRARLLTASPRLLMVITRNHEWS